MIRKIVWTTCMVGAIILVFVGFLLGLIRDGMGSTEMVLTDFENWKDGK